MQRVKYLECVLTEDSVCATEIRTCIGLAKAAFRKPKQGAEKGKGFVRNKEKCAGLLCGKDPIICV